jgi:prepilin-type N-terminal cleavage/methylation domain-containing protein
MNLVPGDERQHGFTLVELLVALGIFLVITGAAFSLLGTSQKHYQTESQLLTSFQEARLGLDQIVRDVNDAGYPPPTFADGVPADSASSPFAWSTGAGYPPPGSCQIGTGGGGTCSTATAGDAAPGDFDLIIETNPNPQDPSCLPNCRVQWIRYQLQNTTPLPTLMRGVSAKATSGDPDTSTAGMLVPFVQNIVNTQVVQNVTNPLVAQYQAAYPGIFPGGAPVPIFQYTCDTPSVSQSLPLPTVACRLATPGDNSPANIRDVMITLIVAAPLPDATTGQPRLVMLNGRGRRINPNQ